MRIVKLSNVFYEKYGKHPEIMKKESRPYYCLELKVNGTLYAIPFRHHIRHQYAFKTIGESGIDYSKAVVIQEKTMVSADTVRIDSAEWNVINSHEHDIFIGFNKYLRLYERAKKNSHVPKYQKILKYCTLKYFEK